MGGYSKVLGENKYNTVYHISFANISLVSAYFLVKSDGVVYIMTSLSRRVALYVHAMSYC